MIRKYSVPVGLLDGIFGVEGDPLLLSRSDIQITDWEAQERVLSIYPWLRSEEQACCPWYNFEFILELRRDGLDDIQRYVST